METRPNQGVPGLIGPAMMILTGILFLIGQLMPEWGFGRLWPVLLIGAGVAQLLSRR